MKIRARTVMTLVVLLALCGCRKKQEDCAKLEVRRDRLTWITQGEMKQAEMREFLWNHWHNGRCATLLLKSISLEGKETDDIYEIKLLPAATLAMVVTTNRASYGYQGQVFWHEIARYEAYTVERVQPNNPYLLNANSKVEILPDNAHLSGSEYCLRFKGWGNEVESFF